MQIEPIDATDDKALESWHAPLAAATAADWPDGPGWSLEERTALVRQPTVSDHVLAVARVSGEVAGSILVRLPLRETLESANVEVTVHPAHRGDGVGRALLAHAEDVVRARGRSKAIGGTESPIGSPGAARHERFARAAGYEVGLTEARRELALPTDRDRLDALEAEARPFAADYEIVTWIGHCPPQWERGRIAVARNISTDAPHGTIEVDEEDWDAGRLRLFYDTVEAMGRDALAAAAIDRAGDLVAFSEIGLPRATPRFAFQFDTVVLPAHRGNRLGLLVKIANLRALGARSPASERVVTWNAVSNEPMVRVNETLGFELVGLGTVWQKSIA